MIVFERFLVGPQEIPGAQQLCPSLRRTGIRQIVVRAGQLAAQFRRALLLWQNLDGVNDFLVLIVVVPDLALFH